MKSFIYSVLFVFAFLFDTSFGWAISLPFRGKSQKIAGAELPVAQDITTVDELAYRIGTEAEEWAVASSLAAATVLEEEERAFRETPARLDLPKHSPPADVVQKTIFLLDTEIYLGRIAMLAAVVLLAGEIFTGTRVSDQIMSAMFIA